MCHNAEQEGLTQAWGALIRSYSLLTSSNNKEISAGRLNGRFPLPSLISSFRGRWKPVVFLCPPLPDPVTMGP